MSTNLAYAYFEEPKNEELIDGQIVAMAPARTEHNSASTAIAGMFWNHFRGKKCRVYSTEAMTILSENDHFAPDVMVVCRSDIAIDGKIIGAPELVVEVLSRSTAKRDRGYKKNAYEKHGVKEYWIVDVEFRIIEVFVLLNGKFEMDNIYSGDESGTTFSPSIFEDLVISVDEVFEKVD